MRRTRPACGRAGADRRHRLAPEFALYPARAAAGTAGSRGPARRSRRSASKRPRSGSLACATRRRRCEGPAFDAAVTAILARLPAHAIMLAPWPHDPHCDHEAAHLHGRSRRQAGGACRISPTRSGAGRCRTRPRSADAAARVAARYRQPSFDANGPLSPRMPANTPT